MSSGFYSWRTQRISLGITLMVSEVFDELHMQVMPGAASESESGSGLYSVVCL